MRCKNCGFDNASGVAQCEKCGESLGESSARSTPSPESAPAGIPAGTLKGAGSGIPHPATEEKMAKTVKSNVQPEMTTCPHCNYPLRQGIESCPNCHKKISPVSSGTAEPGRAAPLAAGSTFNPYDNQKQEIFFLTPIPRVNEPEMEKIEFKGEKVELNRDNLEEDNNTITGKTQAVVEFIDGKWYLTDKSKLKTTFMYVSGPLELKNGDIILFGDRQFKFET